MSEASFGKYKLIAELGHGGMADVFLAVQAGPAGSGFRKLTVIKRLRQNLVDEPEFVAMLVDEARIAAGLNHPNVVQTNEVGREGEQYFIAMEYLDGQPLHRIQHRAAQRAKESGVSPLSREQQCIVLMDCLSGLHHAHELADFDGTPLQIVHRDMTPHNIFVTYEGQVKVVDFGIAKAVGRASETRQGIVKGKVRYMAPEQALGQNVDRRADLFSVGVMLWEAAAGRRLWKDVDDFQIVQALIDGSPILSPKEVDPTVPDELAQICQKALALRRDDRYSTAEDFRADIEMWLGKSGALVEARRELTKVIGALFKEKRQEIRRVIEKQLSELDLRATTSTSNVGAIIPIGSDSAPLSMVDALPANSVNRLSTQVLATNTAAPVSAASESISNQPVAMVQPAKKARGAVVALAVSLFVALGVIAVAAWKYPSRRDTGNPAVEDLKYTTITVEATPPSAKVYVDDVLQASNPATVRYRRDGAQHRVRAEALGHRLRVETVAYDAEERKVVINLDPDVPVASSHTTPPTPPTTRQTGGGFVPTRPTATRDPAPSSTPLPPFSAVAPPTPTPASSKGRKPQLEHDIWDQ